MRLSFAPWPTKQDAREKRHQHYQRQHHGSPIPYFDHRKHGRRPEVGLLECRKFGLFKSASDATSDIWRMLEEGLDRPQTVATAADGAILLCHLLDTHSDARSKRIPLERCGSGGGAERAHPCKTHHVYFKRSGAGLMPVCTSMSLCAIIHHSVMA